MNESHPAAWNAGGNEDTMAISTTRPATPDDEKRYQAAALRFAKNHDIQIVTETRPDLDVEFHIDHTDYNQRELRSAWNAAIKRALRGDGDTIAYGYVGWHVD